MTIREMLRKLKQDRALIDEAIVALQKLQGTREVKKVSRRKRLEPELMAQAKKNGTEGTVIPFLSAR